MRFIPGGVEGKSLGAECVVEVGGTGMFGETTNVGTNGDVLGKALHARTQRKHAAHDKVYLHARL